MKMLIFVHLPTEKHVVGLHMEQTHRQSCCKHHREDYMWTYAF